MRGGYRPNSGPKKGTKYRPRSSKNDSEPKEKPKKKRENKAKDDKDAGKLLPLDYMLQVMNDPKEESAVRRQMAIAAAPYIHPRKGEGLGKKEERDGRARAAGSGKFAAGKAPLTVVK